MRTNEQSRPQRVSFTVLLLALVCLLGGIVGLLLLPPAVAVLTRYQAPDAAAAPPPATSGTRLSERVVLLVLHGISTGELARPGEPWSFVQLRRRAAEGAYGTALAVQPAGDAPTWAALISGAEPARSGIVDAREQEPLATPSLFDLAGDDRQTAVVASAPAWKARQALARPDQSIIAPSSATVGVTATAFLRPRSADFVAVMLDVGQSLLFGREERMARLDAQIAAIAAVLDPRRDTLIVVGDHGTLADGSSGGREADVARVPLVLWGRGIVPGELGVVAQRDIAPTAAALLGLPYPPVGGRPLLAALAFDPPAQARELTRLLAARVGGAAVSANSSTAAARRLVEARQALDRGDWEAARGAADVGLAAFEPVAGPPWYVTSSWTWGGAIPLLLIVLAVAIGRARHRLAFLLAPLAGLGAYLLLWSLIFFGLAGRTISLSALYGDWSMRLAEVGLWSALALAATAVGFGLVRARRSPGAPIREVGQAGLLVILCLLVIAAGYVGIVGLPDPGTLPNLLGWTGLLLVLAQLAGVGLATPLAMALAAVIGEVGRRGR